MNIALWVLQSLLAGGMRILAYDRMVQMARQRDPDGVVPMSRGFAALIGASQVAGSAGLIRPWGTA
jgi:hypothetical protein